MEEILRFTIPLVPVTKKNHQQIAYRWMVTKSGTHKRVPFILPSKQFLEYQEECMYYIPKKSTIDTYCNVKCIFYMPTLKRVDLANLLAAIDDIMVEARLLEDDNCTIIAGHDGSRVKYDKQNPRTEVIITKAVG